ncbi:MAG TPA: hypothetical protein ENI20_16090 [Bacteroides sp.]|nr:hypothetical protein [Bacteroides sp.]
MNNHRDNKNYRDRNENPGFSDPFFLEGASFNLEELLSFCRQAVNDKNMPEWKLDVLAFMNLFLDPATGEIEQQTSGTTGNPKKFVLNRGSMIRSAAKTNQYFGLKPGDPVLLCLPIRYIAGKMMVVRALLGGLNLRLAEPSSRPLKAFSTGALKFGAMVPLQVHESLKNGDDLSVMDQLLIGGGEIHPALKDKLIENERPVVFESFATTETYTHFALKRINGKQPDIDFRLLDGVSIARDKNGCLEVVVKGITEGRVITSDFVEVSSDGKGFRWLGRRDNVINSGGIKIIPEVLEQIIREVLGQDCLVLPQNDARLGESLVLVVETREKSPPLDRWLQLLREKLSRFEIPARIIPVERIPRNTSFKPDRGEAFKLL